MLQLDDEVTEIHGDQTTVRNLFIKQISQKYPQIGKDLREIFYISISPNRDQRISVYEKILNKYPFGSDERDKLVDYYAKIMDLERRVRKFVNAKIYNEKIENPNSTATADQFDYVFQKMDQENVEPEILKRFFNESALAIFSLTMHPTNPTSIEYSVEGGIRFDKHLDDDSSYIQHLKQIQTLTLAGRKKTVFEEVEETIAVLDIIYQSSVSLRNQLANTLKDFPKYKQVIDVNRPLIQPAIWPAGDGDGNENANVKALADAIQQLKQRIKQLYLNDLQNLDLKNKSEFIEKLQSNSYRNPNEFIEDLKQFEDTTKDLIYKVTTFGFHYAQIDIRHNAVDVMETLSHLFRVNQLNNDFNSLSLDQQKDFIVKSINNQQTIDQLKSTDETLLNESSPTAARIFGRLKLIKNDLDIFNKFIIAETTSIVHVLAVFLLLKATDNSVAEEDSIIDIVTLSESVKDLEALPDLIQQLIDDPIYRKHLSYRQKLIPMIAKSDTVRRNGRGAEASQEQALGKVYAMLETIKDKYPELKYLSIQGFSGGGAALQRGGGRVTEVPHNNGRIARLFHAKTIGPSILTLQGHQIQILFSPQSICLHTLESLVAQNLYARAQTELRPDGQHYVQPRKAPPNYDERLYIDYFYKACQVMRETYFHFMGPLDDDDSHQSGNQNFNRLFTNAPWISVILGNLSSRPSKRGGHGTDSNQIKAVQLRGLTPKLLSNRAITVERISAHSGTHFLTYLSVYEGLKALNYEDLHPMYICSKSCRDFMRNTALSLHMTDFNLAWLTMIGKDKPNSQQIEMLAKNFRTDKDATNTNEETLAFLEIYAMNVAKLVYKCILGKNPDENFRLETTLRESFSNLSQQLTLREQSDEFGRYAEAKMTNFINQNLDHVLTPTECSTLQSCYVAADVVNAPEGGLNIELTRKKID